MKLKAERIDEVTSYLISFLVRNNELRSYVKYVSEEEAIKECISCKGNVYIVKSGFFEDNYGELISLPIRPLQEFDGIKFFFGKPDERSVNGNIIIYADLIASSYFVLTRYEEMIIEARNERGNFPASECILVKEGLINRPIVDYYGRIIRDRLRNLGYNITEKKGFSKLYFTHDIDSPFFEYSRTNIISIIINIAKSVLKEKKSILHTFRNYLFLLKNDHYRTWKYMLVREQDVRKKTQIETESICFIVSTEEADMYTQAYIRDKRLLPVLNEMRQLGAILGMHTSFHGASDGEAVNHERQVLREVTGDEILYQRNHYLRQIRPYDLEYYENAGFTDDFTSGFNEVIGFRIGTCHPVKWIDPRDARISNMTLHGMEIMDGSVIGEKPYQMELSFEEAQKACKGVIDEIYDNGGEFDFLCHNGQFDKKPGNYIRELYDWILDYIIERPGTNERSSKN